jgi:hypothetical protein
MASAIANSIPPRDRGRNALAPEFVIAAARDRGKENPTSHSPRIRLSYLIKAGKSTGPLEGKLAKKQPEGSPPG